MPLRLDSQTTPPVLYFEGVVTIEETDQLLEALKEQPGLCADLSGCEHLHTAPLQALKLLKVPISTLPHGTFWKFCLDPSPTPAECSQRLIFDP
jgi:hypothetical protein